MPARLHASGQFMAGTGRIGVNLSRYSWVRTAQQTSAVQTPSHDSRQVPVTSAGLSGRIFGPQNATRGPESAPICSEILRTLVTARMPVSLDQGQDA